MTSHSTEARPTCGRRSVASVLAAALTVPAVMLTGLSPAHAAGQAPVFTDAPTNTRQVVNPGTAFVRLRATDLEQDTLTFTTTDPLPAGIALHATTGTLTGVPSAPFDGTVRVQVSDGSGTATTTVHLTVNDVAPSWGSYSEYVDRGQVPRRLRAHDANQTPVTYEVAPGSTLPAGIVLQPDGVFTGATEDLGQTVTRIIATSGDSTITASISFRVTHPYPHPDVVLSYDTTEILFGVDDAGHSIEVVSAPEHGVVHNAPVDGFATLTYTPDAGYVGTDAVSFRVRSSSGAVLDEFSQTLHVSALARDSVETRVNTPLTVTAARLNDRADITELQVEWGASHVADVTVVDGEIVYTPEAGFSGFDAFAYTGLDAHGVWHYNVVDVYVNAVAQDDVANTASATPVTIDVLGNDEGQFDATRIVTTPATRGTVALIEGKLVYTPTGSAGGTDTFTYSVQDLHGERSATASVTVTVAAAPAVDTPVSTPPVTAPVVEPVVPAPVVSPPVVSPPVAEPPVVTPPARKPVKPVVVTPPPITVAKPAVTVARGGRLPVSGTLATTTAGTKVQVQIRQRSGRWVTMGATRTNGKGQYSVGLRAPAKRGVHTYRVLITGTKTARNFTVTVE